MNVQVGRSFAHVDFAFVEDDRHAASRDDLAVMLERGCIQCGAPPRPEPTDEERARIFADPDYTWSPPDGLYIEGGFGLMGGGYGPYVMCDGCGFFLKHDLGPEAE